MVLIKLMQNVASCARHCHLKLPFVFHPATHGPPKTAILMEPAHLFVIWTSATLQIYFHTAQHESLTDQLQICHFSSPNNLPSWLKLHKYNYWNYVFSHTFQFNYGDSFMLGSALFKCSRFSSFHFTLCNLHQHAIVTSKRAHTLNVLPVNVGP